MLVRASTAAPQHQSAQTVDMSALLVAESQLIDHMRLDLAR